MRIGITGATGFVGRALVAGALARGHEVVAFSRGKDVSIPGVKEVRPILTEGAKALDLAGLDALVHLAGENVFGVWTTEKKRRIYDSRVDLTRRIAADVLKAESLKVWVSGSGSGAYGDRGDEILTEQSSAPGAGFLAEVCRDWEGAALAVAADSEKTRVVVIRTGMVLGKDGGAWPMLRKVFAMFLGSPLGSGKQWVPWIHLDDEVGMILHALEHEGCKGPMNLGSPNPVTNEQMTREMAKRIKRPVMPKVPKFMLKLVMGDLSEVVLASQRMEPKLALETGYQFKHVRLADALATLD
ncbi:TIGR01777 family protein [Phragmitibacter flavus]|uniref:TIGR01777 family protein n=2 Tax=Phragmitibacter flavus TaxID=2576071 RepID=A0A5R8K7M4_9BACT|nr:TIGR01777 family protein [Phragmitibacter flavus]